MQNNSWILDFRDFMLYEKWKMTLFSISVTSSYDINMWWSVINFLLATITNFKVVYFLITFFILLPIFFCNFPFSNLFIRSKKKKNESEYLGISSILYFLPYSSSRWVRTLDYLIIAQYGTDKCTGQAIFLGNE